MNSKVIGVIVVVIVIIAAALFFIFRGSGSPTTPSSTTGANASSTAQVQGQDIAVGTGAEAQPGDTVSVLYVGYLGSIATSTIFDSSADHGDQPLTFVLGSQGLIPGFQIGVNGMKVGGERLLAVPPSLGYGSQAVTDSTGKVIIPANSTLIFDVKLVSVTPGTSTSATTSTQ